MTSSQRPSAPPYLGDLPVLGLPGCVIYSRTSIFDLVLPPLSTVMRFSRCTAIACRSCRIRANVIPDPTGPPERTCARCPVCGQALIPEDLAKGKIQELERTLEEK